RTTTYDYDAAGRLLSITRPFPNAVTSFTYDGFNRVSSSTDSQGYKLLFTYDKADRPLTIKYPDTTFTKFVYNLWDLASRKDRLNRPTNYVYDALRRRTKETDPLGRTTQYAYCDCGALSQIIDPNGNATQFNYDLQERPIAKIFADGTKNTTAYEKAVSRVKKTTDALGQS